MRTVILLSGLEIAEHLPNHFEHSERILNFFAVVLMIAIVMDVVEFVIKLFKK